MTAVTTTRSQPARQSAERMKTATSAKQALARSPSCPRLKISLTASGRCPVARVMTAHTAAEPIRLVTSTATIVASQASGASRLAGSARWCQTVTATVVSSAKSERLNSAFCRAFRCRR